MELLAKIVHDVQTFLACFKMSRESFEEISGKYQEHKRCLQKCAQSIAKHVRWRFLSFSSLAKQEF